MFEKITGCNALSLEVLRETFQFFFLKCCVIKDKQYLHDWMYKINFKADCILILPIVRWLGVT